MNVKQACSLSCYKDPVLFSGSIRRNLDPFNQYEDSGLWNALQEVCLIFFFHFIRDSKVSNKFATLDGTFFLSVT